MSQRRFKRKSGFRDAKLIVIASEGINPEKKYFETLSASLKLKNVHFHFIDHSSESHKSAPSHVLERLKRVKREYSLNIYDELWMVIDKDRWPEKQLSAIAKECEQAGFNLAVSNPSFELWILLHFEDISLDERRDAKKLKGYLREKNLLGQQFNDDSRLQDRLKEAVARAEKLDKKPRSRWPEIPGTRVYLIFKDLL